MFHGRSKEPEKRPQPSPGSLMLIGTQGRYSGQREINFLAYRRDRDRFVVAATNHDGLFKPDWYLNLKEEPLVDIEVEGVHYHARARTPVGRERVGLWSLVAEISNLSESQMPRETAIVVIEPICEVNQVA